jgi:hypothetical protein
LEIDIGLCRSAQGPLAAGIRKNTRRSVQVSRRRS